MVRPLDARLGTVPDVLAASLLEDGTPIVILDPDDLVRSIDDDLGDGRLRRMARTRPHAAPAMRRILVVDDSLTVREVERQLLEAQGYKVETAIDALPGVAESALFGVPHPDFGEVGVAVVTLTPGAGFDEAQAVEALRTRLAGYKVPKRLMAVDELPRNGTGKVLKSTLRDSYRDLFASMAKQ